MPKHRQARLPEWGIEQRKTFGLNQTAPEWAVRWVLRPDEADALDAFFADRASNNEWFLWRPPYHNQGRYRCDEWTKTAASCVHSEVQATIRLVFSFNLRSFRPSTGTFEVETQDAIFRRGYSIRADVETLSLTGADVTLSKTRPMYIDPGAFTVAGQPAALLRGYAIQAAPSSFALTGTDAALLYLSLQSDYFGNMASQIWGWDREFQVDWWGD